MPCKGKIYIKDKEEKSGPTLKRVYGKPTDLVSLYTRFKAQILLKHFLDTLACHKINSTKKIQKTWWILTKNHEATKINLKSIKISECKNQCKGMWSPKECTDVII